MTSSEEINNLKLKRFLFLKTLYEKSGGNRLEAVNQWTELGTDLGFEPEETNSISQYLSGEGLIKELALGGKVGITHRGIQEVEEAIANPNKTTEYFPPVINILNIQNNNGQVQQGSINSNQHSTISSFELQALLGVMEEIVKSKNQLNLPEESLSELETNVKTIELQAQSAKPNKNIIKESLKSVRSILEQVGAGIAVEVLKKLSGY